MNTFVALAAPHDVGPVLAIFAIFVVLTLLLSLLGTTSEGTDLSDFYVGRRRLSSAVNGIALFGGYMSAASMLGNPGQISLNGFDGIAYVLAPAVTWVVVLMLVAEPYHSTSRFTVGDTLAHRLRSRPVHLAAGITTLFISLPYLIAQLVGAGVLAAPVLGYDGPAAQRGIVACLGLVMILFVVLGGMRVTTLLETVKAVLMIGACVALALAVLWRFGWNPADLLSQAAGRSGFGEQFLRPGIRYDDGVSKLDLVSLQVAFLLGAAGLPHVLMRLSTVSTGPRARRSVQWMGLLNLGFVVLVVVNGLGATALLSRDTIVADADSGNTAILLVAEHVGGTVLLTVISCVVFVTILTVVAGITLTVACALAHDIYGAVIMRGRSSEKSELLVARLAVVFIGLVTIVLSLYAQHLPISFLVSLAFAIAASAVLPAILFTLWWKGFTTRGAIWSMYGGLSTAVLLVALSPAVSGDPHALLPDADFAVFPLRNPGLVSIPVGFFLGWIGSVRDRREPGGADYTETEIRVLTGAPGGTESKAGVGQPA
ncbi:cation acetate symporter [Streptomyces sp. NBC_00487]|uniref:solute symporter family protein n=1 Tax=unclassified Streptomyces TaxID=2593676 RepID=UPI002E1790A6|nr:MULTISPECIES: cation acetate symporter [unclassified Streptomyces]